MGRDYDDDYDFDTESDMLEEEAELLDGSVDLVSATEEEAEKVNPVTFEEKKLKSGNVQLIIYGVLILVGSLVLTRFL